MWRLLTIVWLRSLNIDSTNFILLGRSAGGQIALLSAYTLHNPNIKGVISFYAPADMVYGATIAGNKWVLDTDKVLADYIGGSYKEVPKKYVKSSPIESTDKNSPPTLIIHGEHDAMVAYEHSTRLSAKLEAVKVPYYFLSLPCATHGCDYTINGPSGQMSTFAIERFINSVTNSSCKN
jgi:acetyl esterase/lipase